MVAGRRVTPAEVANADRGRGEIRGLVGARLRVEEGAVAGQHNERKRGEGGVDRQATR